MTTTHTVLLTDGKTTVEADGYRTSTEDDLYFYVDDEDDPVAMFPRGAYHGVFETHRGSPLDSSGLGEDEVRALVREEFRKVTNVMESNLH